MWKIVILPAVLEKILLENHTLILACTLKCHFSKMYYQMKNSNVYFSMFPGVEFNLIFYILYLSFKSSHLHFTLLCLARRNSTFLEFAI